MAKELIVPVEVSNRHIHFSEKDFFALFGENAVLTKMKDLSQPGQFAANETVTLIGPKGSIDKVRILGPFRKETQVEVSRSDCFKLGINTFVRDSGDLENTAGIKISNGLRSIDIPKGVIIAKNHIHMSVDEARIFNVKDGDYVALKVENSERSISFNKVLIRVNKNYRLAFHVDTDEANAGIINTGDKAVFLGKLLIKNVQREKNKRELITEEKLKKYLSEDPHYTLSKDAIISPQARDYARLKGLLKGNISK